MTKLLSLVALVYLLTSCSQKYRKMDTAAAHEFIQAAALGDLAKVQSYIKQGIDPDSRNINGTTALMMAAKNGHIRILNFLGPKSKNLSWTDPDGDNVMTFAIAGGQVESVKALLDLGIGTELKVYNNFSPLILAIHQGRSNIALLFIARGADVNVTDLEGNSPLHIAVEKNQEEVLTALLQARANTKIKNHEGQTALELATVENNLRLVEKIRSAQ